MVNQPSELGILSHQAIHHVTRWKGEAHVGRSAMYLNMNTTDLANLCQEIDNGDTSSRTAYSLGMILGDSLFNLLIISALVNIDLKIAYDQYLSRKEQEFKKNGKSDLEIIRQVAPSYTGSIPRITNDQ